MTMTGVLGSEAKYRKHFIPLESDPEIFTDFIHTLGLPPTLSFLDVLSIDEPRLLAFFPKPVFALILIFPTAEGYETRIQKEDKARENDVGVESHEDVVFFRQTINNACGLYAILHAVCNGEVCEKISMIICG